MSNKYYTFLPWLRQGLSTGITTQDDMGAGTASPAVTERVKLPVKLDITKTAAGGTTPGSPSLIAGLPEVLLIGPGDVTGINPSMIVKACPKEGVESFEPNNFPFIEFYDEDFPWRYTPAAPASSSTPAVPSATQPISRNGRLRPWITLLALADNEFTEQDFNGVCNSIQIITGTDLPDPTQTWAWAHVQVNDSLGQQNNGDTMTSSRLDAVLNNSTTGLNKLLATNPDGAFSRLICARRLRPDTRYTMFLVPTFEIGRLSGLDLPTSGQDALASAWSSSTAASDLDIPYYYRWSFVTGSGADFEELVERLKPKAHDTESGKRLVDIQMPGGPLNFTSPVPQIYLEGVLRPALDPPYVPDLWKIGDIASESTFVKNLRTFLNEQDKNIVVPISQTANPTTFYSDPILTAPTYGKWHLMKRQLDTPVSGSPITPKWLDTVNLDPRARIFAGVGAELFREHQEDYMALAWKQIDDVLAANIIINQTKAMIVAQWMAFQKNIATADPIKVASYVTALHSQVSHSTGTIYKTVQDSVVPAGCYTGVFNRINRPGGPFARAVALSTNTAPVGAPEVAAAFNTGAVNATPNLNNPAGYTVMSQTFTQTQTPSYTNSLMPVSNFVLTPVGSGSFVPLSGSMFSTQGAATQSAMASFHQNASVPVNSFTPPTLPQLDYNDLKNTVVDQLDPEVTIPDYVMKRRVSVQPHDNTPPPTLLYDHILATPEMPEPMFRKLADKSLDFIMPGLGSIPDESLTLMEVNQTMIEAFMLGLNFEMNRELLWREYPTDLRGTFFRQFWSPASTPTPNAENVKDIKPIHEWRVPSTNPPVPTLLGANSPRTSDPSGLVVLCVRGELLRKFPNTFVYAQKAKWDTKVVQGNTVNDYTKHRLLDSGSTAVLWPSFSAKLNPDVYFIGFEKSKLSLLGTDFDASGNPTPSASTTYTPDPGYYFVFEERLGETRFGLDVFNATVSSTPTWDDLQWGHFMTGTEYKYVPVTASPSFTISSNPELASWGSNSADIAYATYQKPVRVCVHARQLLDGI